MRRFDEILGPAGLILILAGSVVYGVLYGSGWPVFLPLLAGLALSAAALILGYRKSRSEGVRRYAKYGINTGVTVIAVATLIFFLQTISTRHGFRMDTTANRRFSISPQTVKVLGGVESEITFTCFFRDSAPEKMQVYDLLREYRGINPRITARFIDPDQDPVAARKYNVKDYGAVYAEVPGRLEQVEGFTEEKFTNVINRILSQGVKTVYFTTGHGERSIDDTGPTGFSSLGEAIRAENFEVREFIPLGSGGIPRDCSVLAIAGPTKDIFEPEQNLIFDYLTGGGKAILLIDPVSDLPLISALSMAFGIRINDDIIVDRYGKMLAGNYLTPVVNQYGKHPITEGFRLFTFFPMARSIGVLSALPDAVTVTVLCKTDREAYAETDIDTLLSIGKTQYEGGKDVAGPVSLAAAGEMTIVPTGSQSNPAQEDRASRIVVFGDSDFAANSDLKLSGNRDLILNALNWLAEDEDLISIRPVDNINQPVLLSTRQGRVVFWLSMVALPAIFAVAGILIDLGRRRSG